MLTRKDIKQNAEDVRLKVRFEVSQNLDNRQHILLDKKGRKRNLWCQRNLRRSSTNLLTALDIEATRVADALYSKFRLVLLEII